MNKASLIFVSPVGLLEYAIMIWQEVYDGRRQPRPSVLGFELPAQPPRPLDCRGHQARHPAARCNRYSPPLLVRLPRSPSNLEVIILAKAVGEE
jgi:hypothetical protein